MKMEKGLSRLVFWKKKERGCTIPEGCFDDYDPMVETHPVECVQDLPGWREVHDLSKRVDEQIIRICEEKAAEIGQGISLVALGGYGRRELCPCSDVDLLILTEKGVSRDRIAGMISEIVYPLWDMKLDASHSVRTVEEAIEDASKDFLLLTSLLDARLLYGSEKNFRKLVHEFREEILAGRRGSFIEDLMLHNERRHEQFGDDTYSLEPDLKEGHGGLRDYHSILWAAKALFGLSNFSQLLEKGLITERDREEIEIGVDFILQVRCKLHHLSKRKNDRLFFQHQEALAREMGIREPTPEKTVESFMKVFHHEVFHVKAQSEAFLERARDVLDGFRDETRFGIDEDFEVVSGRINFSSPESLEKNPTLLLRLFEHMSHLDRAMHPSARQIVRTRLDLTNAARESMEAKSSFRRTLLGVGVGRSLLAMLETGVLERFMPAFQKIKAQTQFDVYHTWTADHHSILAVQELINLQNDEDDVFGRIRDIELVAVAALLHDIGKGFGSPHSETGADVARDLTLWLGFGEDDAEIVKFLVQKHLRLAETAMRRDLSEERVAFRFAKEIGRVETLCMLYLITIADARATGPTAWSSWKASLVSELFMKSLKILERGSLKDPYAVAGLEERWVALRGKAADIWGKESEKRLDQLPQEYVLSFPPETIFKHFDLSEKVKSPSDVAVDVEPCEGLFEVTISAMDRPGLFARLAGVFALNHFDIRRAKVFTWFNGIALDVFEVKAPWDDYQEWERIRKDFEKAVSGKLALTAKMSSVKPPRQIQQKLTPRMKTQVVVLPDASDFFTVIEVFTPDRMGILSEVARAISELDLDICRAFISDKGDLAADVFYVRNLMGDKIDDAEQRAEIVRAIEHALN